MFFQLSVSYREDCLLAAPGFAGEDHFLYLTDIGLEVAETIYERHCFFTELLIAAGVDPKTAEADACRMEHVISTESFLRLKEAAAQEQEQIL